MAHRGGRPTAVLAAALCLVMGLCGIPTVAADPGDDPAALRPTGAVVVRATDGADTGTIDESMAIRTPQACPIGTVTTRATISAASAGPSAAALWAGVPLGSSPADAAATVHPIAASWSRLILTRRVALVPATYTITLECADPTGTALAGWRADVLIDPQIRWHGLPAPATSTATASAARPSAPAPPSSSDPPAAPSAPTAAPSRPAPSPAPGATGPPSPPTSAPSPTTALPAGPAILTVQPSEGEAFADVRLRVAAVGAAGAVCEFRDGDRVLGSVPSLGDGSCLLETNALGPGGHDLRVMITFGGQTRTSEPVRAAYRSPETDRGRHGAGLTIYTPYTADRPLDLGVLVLTPDGRSYAAGAEFGPIHIIDSRPHSRGWSATIQRSDFLSDDGLHVIPADRTGLVELAIRGANGMPGRLVTLTDVPPGKDPTQPAEFARATSSRPVTAVLDGRFVLADVPTSLAPGRYSATVTFTVG